jgi:hypothetical protein
MLNGFKRHWPEYLMEAAGLGTFMVSACVFAILLWHPGSPLLQLLPDPLARRLLNGLAMGFNRRTDRFAMPLLQMAQGVPSLSWVIIAVIWFKDMEARALFVLLASGLPNFSIQIHDAVRDEGHILLRLLHERQDPLQMITWSLHEILVTKKHRALRPTAP